MQRRIREAGRIRGGDRKQGNRAGAKLLTPRFSSPDRAVIEAAAEHFGGTVREWDNSGRQEWDVVVKEKVLDVIVPPTGLAFSQWMETWSGGGCERRCDGQRELLSDQPCLCDPEAPDCMPTTRLSLIVPDLETFGLFRLESHGWNAAQELSGTAELAGAFAERGQYLPATLHFEPRERRQPGKPIKKFTVPVVDLKVPMRRFMEVVSAQVGAPALPMGTPAIDSPAFTPVAELPAAPVGSIADQVAGAGRERQQRRGGAEPLRPTGRRPRAAVEVVEAGTAPSSTGGEGGDTGPSLPSPPGSPDGGEPTGASGAHADRAAAGEDGATGDAEASPPATAGSSAAASPPSDVSQKAKARATHIAIACREIGIDKDEKRHAFIALVTDGRASSGKQLDDVDFALVQECIGRVKDGRLRLVHEVEGGIRLDEVEPADVGATSDDESFWSADRWREFVKAHKTTQVAALRHARAVAEELAIEPPAAFAEWTDGRISAAVRQWVENRDAA